MKYYTLNDLQGYGPDTVAHLLNTAMVDEIKRNARLQYPYRDYNVLGEEYLAWGEVTIYWDTHNLLDQSNNQAILEILSDHIESGDIEVDEGQDCIRVRIYRIRKHKARVYDEDGYVINGDYTEAFGSLYDNVIYALSRYCVLDDEDYYEREYKSKIAAFESEWAFIIKYALDDDFDQGFDKVEAVKEDVFQFLDGSDFVELFEKYEGPSREIPMEDDGAYVDSDKILAALEFLGLVEKGEPDRTYYGSIKDTWRLVDPPTPEELAQIEAQKYQMGFALV